MRKILLQILCFSFIFMGILALTRFFMLQGLGGDNQGFLGFISMVWARYENL
ncbi:hypothetical protein [Helicobacter winghamensis]|uniref:hypothetical protein n=1 Tax=Helicobacter winghamensis TaxID=157268 RepID=UPI00351B462B